jgi:hypothetical protein
VKQAPRPCAFRCQAHPAPRWPAAGLEDEDLTELAARIRASSSTDAETRQLCKDLQVRQLLLLLLLTLLLLPPAACRLPLLLLLLLLGTSGVGLGGS